MVDQPGNPEAKLTCYSAGEQPLHEHSHDQLSLVLLGDLQEQSEGWDVDIHRPMLGFKPAGTRHSNRWGPDGTLVFSVRLDAGWCGADQQLCGWWPTPQLGALKALARCYLRESDGRETVQYLWDFVALAAEMSSAVGRRRPAWLLEVRDRLRSDPEGTRISAVAAEFGLHRVHLARSFAEYYGIPPSIYRSRCKAMKAVAAAVSTDHSLTLAGQAGGFFDQSHASRTVKRETGMSLGDIRRFSELH